MLQHNSERLTPQLMDLTLVDGERAARNDFLKDRYRWLFVASIQPFTTYLARMAALRYGGDWQASFTVEDWDYNDPEHGTWSAGIIALSKCHDGSMYLITVETFGCDPLQVTIEDGFAPSLSNISIEKSAEAVAHALWPGMESEMGIQPKTENPINLDSTDQPARGW